MYFFSFQLWSVFSTTNRMKNRPLVIPEPQAHKELNPSLGRAFEFLISAMALWFNKDEAPFFQRHQKIYLWLDNCNSEYYAPILTS